MKKMFLLCILIFGLGGVFNSNAQQIQLSVNPFTYQFSDRSYISSPPNHLYQAWEIVTNHDKTEYCSTPYFCGYVNPGVVNTVPVNSFLMDSDANGYYVCILIVRDNEPIGSGLNRAGWDGPLFPDMYNTIHPQNMTITGW
ncbi:MAG: hypothetical protein Q8867_00900 [Bacteroidota bacterium]|nr:hypothetical protein [Bacteroidota bacterium]